MAEPTVPAVTPRAGEVTPFAAALPPSKTTISDQIFGKCSAALGMSSSRCDGITSADISVTTANELKSIYASGVSNDKWRIMGLLLEADFVGKACQVKINGMY